MRKSSEPPPRGLSFNRGILAVLLAMAGAGLWAQTQAPAPTSPEASRPKVGVALFAEIGEEARLALRGSAAASGAEFLEAAGKGGRASALAASLSSTLRSSLEPLPAARPGSYLLSSPDADRPLWEASRESLEACGNLVAGLCSLAGGRITCDLYLLSSSPDKAELLGSWSGGYDELSGFADSAAAQLLPRLSGGAGWVVDLSSAAPRPSLSFSGAAPEAEAAELTGSRLFVYRAGVYELSISARGFLEKRISISAPLHTVYNKIYVELEADPAAASVPAAEALKAAAADLNWKSKDLHSANVKGFSAALGRLVLSLPVSALALGVFYLGYEGYSRSAMTEAGLWVRGGAAGLSLAASAAFIVDAGIWLARLIASAR